MKATNERIASRFLRTDSQTRPPRPPLSNLPETCPTERPAGLRLNTIDTRIARRPRKHRRQKRIDRIHLALNVNLDMRIDVTNAPMNVEPPRYPIDGIAKPNPLHDPVNLDNPPNHIHSTPFASSTTHAESTESSKMLGSFVKTLTLYIPVP